MKLHTLTKTYKGAITSIYEYDTDITPFKNTNIKTRIQFILTHAFAVDKQRPFLTYTFW